MSIDPEIPATKRPEEVGSMPEEGLYLLVPGKDSKI